MFKVICIDAGNQKNDGTPNVVEGEVYTPIGETISKCSWVLKELDRGICENEIGGYKKYRFIPLSDIDELELVNEKQLVNQ